MIGSQLLGVGRRRRMLSIYGAVLFGAASLWYCLRYVPEQVARGTMLRILVSDADLLNRASRGFAFAGPGSGPTSLLPRARPARAAPGSGAP